MQVYDFLTGGQNENGKFVRNTTVEWSHTTVDMRNGDFVSSTRQVDRDGSGRAIIDAFHKQGIETLQHTHNHPDTGSAPSGLIQGKMLNPRTGQYEWMGDMGMAEDVTNRAVQTFDRAPKFYISTPSRGRKAYNMQSRPSHFGLPNRY